MKKIVTLVLVLSMVSTASALLQISANGDPDPVDSEIWLDPSDTLVLDILTDAMINNDGTGITWMLVVDTTMGTLSGGVKLGFDPGVFVMGATDGPAGAAILPPPGEEGIWGGAIAVLAPIQAGTVLIDLIDFHCEWGPNDTVISLYEAIDGVGVGQLQDTLTIHQTPEPATMALLGLGGLLLRRKK